MKAVNQCIGRAVRHREDYATVLLLDGRYARQNTLRLLPGWIQGSLQTHHKMGPAIAAVAKVKEDTYPRLMLHFGTQPSDDNEDLALCTVS